jgi:hypothetical protein
LASDAQTACAKQVAIADGLAINQAAAQNDVATMDTLANDQANAIALAAGTKSNPAAVYQQIAAAMPAPVTSASPSPSGSGVSPQDVIGAGSFVYVEDGCGYSDPCSVSWTSATALVPHIWTAGDLFREDSGGHWYVIDSGQKSCYNTTTCQVEPKDTKNSVGWYQGDSYGHVWFPPGYEPPDGPTALVYSAYTYLT